MDKVRSELYNIKSIIEKDFCYNIPRYQRLFVWEDEQVKTLFNDILTASQTDRDLYYIGGIITVKNDKIKNCFDLVDGQQRFTTLWLLANELGAEIKDFTKCSSGLRLKFSIRPKVEAYFKTFGFDTDKETKSNDFDDLVRISKACRTIQSLITQNLNGPKKRKRFIDFLYYKVKMVITEVPPATDLNKLFETLNNRGEQLAQHEILKSQLLSKIQSNKRRYRYSLLWNSCSDMNNYLERCLTYEIGDARAIADSYNYWKHDWAQIKNILKGESEKNESLTLSELIRKKNVWELDDEWDEDDFDVIHHEASDEELEKVRSILTFPQLLLHTLRIFLYQKDEDDIQRINEKELLTTFSDHLFITRYPNLQAKIEGEERESLEFMNLLFRVREAFDKYIIKWVEVDENEEVHLIKKVYKQNQKKGGWSYYLRRQKTQEFDGLSLLQSILYHSQQNTTQYWLTPFLYYLIDFPDFNDAFVELKKLDNILFSSLQEHRGLPERTWVCMEKFPEILPTAEELSEDLGTEFPHYWFYKLEFVLWHERAALGKEAEWSDYKMTARNSVEHISPQNPRNPKDKLCIQQLNKFGNLVLVTRSINSEYSDLPYRVKKAKFEDKKLKGSFDSLKSDIIYSYNSWNDALARQHKKKMIELMEGYFEKTMNDE